MSSQPPGRVTIEDVAREADVSYATVSRVVNNKGYVSEETRLRVNEVVDRIGYVVNRQARGLAGGKSQVIGLVVPDLDSSYMSEIIRGIDSELAAASYDLMLYTTRHRQNRESAHVATLTGGMVDGLLLILPTASSEYLTTFRERKFPCVLIDHRGSNETGPSVGATNYQGGYDATRYLIELGHKRIGMITGNPEMVCAVDRLKGYQQALRDNNISPDPDLIRTGNFYQPRGFECARELLSLNPVPTAIFAANDVSAFGAMEAIRDSGRRIGNDISLIGFDDIPAASNVYPPLTTVRQPLYEMGATATRMLLDLIGNPARKGERVLLPTSLVIRDSCRPPAGQ